MNAFSGKKKCLQKSSEFTDYSRHVHSIDGSFVIFCLRLLPLLPGPAPPFALGIPPVLTPNCVEKQLRTGGRGERETDTTS